MYFFFYILCFYEKATKFEKDIYTIFISPLIMSINFNCEINLPRHIYIMSHFDNKIHFWYQTYKFLNVWSMKSYLPYSTILWAKRSINLVYSNYIFLKVKRNSGFSFFGPRWDFLHLFLHTTVIWLHSISHGQTKRPYTSEWNSFQEVRYFLHMQKS